MQRTTTNQELLVRFPTTQQELASRILDKLVQPHKISDNTSKGSRYKGLGEASGGNTTSPDRARCRRDGEYFSSTLTQDVSLQNFMTNSAVDVLSAVSEEPLLGSTLGSATEPSDLSTLIIAPIIENGLTQEM